MNKKKIFALILSFSMLFSTSMTSMATEIGQIDDYADMKSEENSVTYQDITSAVNTGDILSPVESMEEQLAGLSAEQRTIAIKKFMDDGSETEVTPYAATWKSLYGFVMYKQEKSYYCVVASCKAAIQYLTGSSDSQDTIAKELGTDSSGTPFGNAKKYLNNHLSDYAYIAKSANTSQSMMETNFYTAIYVDEIPPLISVKFSTTNGWPYDTSGHTMCICGARSDKAYFRVADPYILWVDTGKNMTYEKDSSAIHTAIADRGNGYIY